MIELTDIQSPADIKGLGDDELRHVAHEIRRAMLQWVSTVGGHVGPNLGVVEATIALYQVFDAPEDKIVWDVSHQDIAHKMLTGRMKYFTDPSLYSAIGEYTDPNESPYDLFYAGHTSPSITLAAGLAKARDLQGEEHAVVAFIGDGSLSGGVAFEGLDAAATLNSNFIVIVNDNQMAIAENHGSLYDNLLELRETNGMAADNYFKTLGYDYIYVKEGNDLPSLREAFQKAKASKSPVVVHINTQKGEGYGLAEEYRERFHWSVPFDVTNGNPKHDSGEPTYDTLTRDMLIELIETDAKTLVVNPATPGSFGFTPEVRKRVGAQFWDVGIAEQCGVSVAAGAAKGGLKPILAVETSFLQRAFDQLVEDLSLDNLPATLLVLDAGVYGIPDATHLGLWDMVMLSNIPNLVYLGPTNAEEYKAMLTWAHNQTSHSVAIRVPTTSLTHAEGDVDTDYSTINIYKMAHRGSGVALVGASNMYVVARKAAEILAGQGIDATLINPRFLSGVDEDMMRGLKKDHKAVITLEDSSLEGGLGEKIARVLGPTGMKVRCLGLQKEFIDRYNAADILEAASLTPQKVADIAQEMLK